MARLPLPLFPKMVRWLTVASVAAFILYFSVLATPAGQGVSSRPDLFQLVPEDKWNHFIAYAVLAAVLTYATVDWELPPCYLMTIVVVCTVSYGVAIELVQSLLPNRYFSVMDVYANLLGTLIIVPWFLVQYRFVPYIVPVRRILD